MRLCIHWRARHVTAERLHALRAVLDEFPGADEVQLHFSQTEGWRLPITCDAEARGLIRAAHHAMGSKGMAHVTGYPDAF